MPEIGEVARIVHYLRKHLVGRTVKTCKGFNDDIVYGKVGCSADAFSKAVEGKKVLGAGQQGKYFYLTFDSPPHSVMHLGMTGWIKFSTEETFYYKQAVEEDKKPEEWPPNEKWTKWLIKCDKEGGREPVEVAFVDARRLGRIRLIDCDADNIRKVSPLKENGPDPVIDKDTLTVEWLSDLLNRKKVPIKALLLDQANISGVGNWVADEILYQARIHPEQYCNTFDQDQIKRIHDSLIGVCTTACELLADSSKFPEDWLMKYRWDKGKKEKNVLPNGNKIEHLTVGGRTSAIVPAVQKKTAAVAGDINGDESKKSVSSKKRKSSKENDDEDENESGEVMPAKKGRGGRKQKVEESKVNGNVEAKPKQGGRQKKVKTGPEEETRHEKRLQDDQEEEAPKPKSKKNQKVKSEAKDEGTSRRSSRNKSRS
ncbi:Formamidopyrimidine-DNA glycosylase [Pseudocercospora fuligena]|uniref:Formamidopyrimidine-DNA glycosylase n=1 Tax=Pseudocercospora fuligena TaxID=685502 RepID=A0A8H6VLT0_9PEZI|nr:Formamidopyrimidine-DNA glycosylase [Pseudocercospora fuligena]